MHEQTDSFCYPVKHCEVYIIRPGDTLFQIAKGYDLTVHDLITANPQITNPDSIYPGQKICIPGGTGGPEKPGGLGQEPAVLTIGFYNQEGSLLPQENGVAILVPVTLVQVTFTTPVSHGYLFFTPSGTETFLYTQLAGIAISDGSLVLQFQWQVPPALLGSVFAIGCNGQSCVQSEGINICSPES